jgi:hypothetical protein
LSKSPRINRSRLRRYRASHHCRSRPGNGQAAKLVGDSGLLRSVLELNVVRNSFRTPRANTMATATINSDNTAATARERGCWTVKTLVIPQFRMERYFLANYDAVVKRPCRILGRGASQQRKRLRSSAVFSHCGGDKLRLPHRTERAGLVAKRPPANAPHPNPPPRGGRDSWGFGFWGNATLLRNKYSRHQYGQFARSTPTAHRASLAITESRKPV